MSPVVKNSCCVAVLFRNGERLSIGGENNGDSLYVKSIVHWPMALGDVGFYTPDKEQVREHFIGELLGLTRDGQRYDFVEGLFRPRESTYGVFIHPDDPRIITRSPNGEIDVLIRGPLSPIGILTETLGYGYQHEEKARPGKPSKRYSSAR